MARVTGLITTDKITEPIREALVRRLPRGKVGDGIGYLLTCPWCASIWVGAIAAPIITRWGGRTALRVAARALALSQIAGMVHKVGRE